MMKTTYRYGLTYRPASFCTLPKGWKLVERPMLGYPDDFWRRVDLPTSASFAFGVVEFDNQLTDEDIRSYQLTPLGSVTK